MKPDKTSIAAIGGAGQAGIGLIEFMVAMLILTIVIAGTIAVQLTSLRTTTDSRTSTVATALAQSRLEEIRSLSWARLRDTAGLVACGAVTERCFDYDGIPLGPDDAPGSPGCQGSPFYRRVTTSTRTPPAPAELAQCTINIVVSWTGQVGSQEISQGMDRTP